jgi:NADH-quinone oxidoreductase subunit J
MLMDSILFYIFAALVLGGAILTITCRSAVHSAISLIVSLVGVAGLYLLQKAEFLFAVQIVLYVGGIMVLFLFVIMLVNLDQAAMERQFRRTWPIGVAAASLVAAEVGYFLYRGAGAFHVAEAGPAVTAAAGLGNTEMIADTLFSEYLLPFEIASILLLVAVVGAVVMAKKRV